MRRQYRLREPFWCWIPGALLAAASSGIVLEAAILTLSGEAAGNGPSIEKFKQSIGFVLTFALVPLLVVFALITKLAHRRRGRAFGLASFLTTASMITLACLFIAPFAGLAFKQYIGSPGCDLDGDSILFLCRLYTPLAASMLSGLVMLVAPHFYLLLAAPAAATALVVFPILVLRPAAEGSANRNTPDASDNSRGDPEPTNDRP